MNQRSLRYTDEKSDKFWTIVLDDCCHTVCYGRYGSAGQTQTKEFPTAAAALKSYEKLVAEKLKKGYGNEGAIAMPQTEVVAEKPVKAAKRKAVTVETSIKPTTIPLATQTLNYPPARSIDLSPEDWSMPSWQPKTPKIKPEAKIFDVNQSKNLFINATSKIQRHSYQFEMWDTIKLPTTLSRQEAYFWLMAMTKPCNNQKFIAENFINSCAQEPFRELSIEDGITLFLGYSHGYQHWATIINTLFPFTDFILKLSNFSKLEDVVLFNYVEKKYGQNDPNYYIGRIDSERDRLIVESRIGQRIRRIIEAVIIQLADGFRENILPYMSVVEVAQMHEQLQPILATENTGIDWNRLFIFAAHLGMHEEIEKLVASWPDGWLKDRPYGHAPYGEPELLSGLENAEKFHVQARRLEFIPSTSEAVRFLIAHTQFSTLDIVHRSILTGRDKTKANSLIKIFSLIKTTEVAPYMLDLWLSSKAPQAARQWLDDHLDYSVLGLLPIAAGAIEISVATPEKDLIKAAIEFLKSLNRKGHESLIRAALAYIQPEIADKVCELLFNQEEKTLIPFDLTTTPQWLTLGILDLSNHKELKSPTWVSFADLPTIAVKNHILTPDQITAILIALRISSLDNPLALIHDLKKYGISKSLDTFVWSLFERWLTESGPSKEKWAMSALGLLGSDTIALKLTPLIRNWPLESQHARAVFGLECLRSIGTDTALMQINGIAQKIKFPGLKRRAQECMEGIAQDRNMTRAELEDRIVPDCDLDDRGTRLFDFGSRQFRFVLGPDLKPMVKDHENKAKTDLPKPNAKDDPEKAEAAIADWKLLKKQINEIIKLQPDRLEQAMVTGRRWNADEFEMLLVKHPLMTHLVQRIIWGSYDSLGQLLETFRVTEDYTYSNLQDELLKIPEHRQIGLIHPLHLSELLRSAWGEVLSDYEIIQPFTQLGRSLYKLDSDEESALEITRFNTVKIPIVSLVRTLEKLSWQRGGLHDHGDYSLHFKYFPAADLTAIVGDYDEVFVDLSVVIGSGLDTIDGCCFLRGMHNALYDYPSHAWMPENNQRIPLGEVDPVIISEVLGDLFTVTAKAQ